MRFRKQLTPEGRGSTVQTLRRMAELTRNSLQDSILREESITLMNTAHASDSLDYARAVRQFVRSSMQLYNEAEELLIDPATQLHELRDRGQLWGDCDDAAMLAGALLMIQGLPVRYKAIQARPEGDFAHVYAEFYYGSRWIPLDTTTDTIPVYAAGDAITETV